MCYDYYMQNNLKGKQGEKIAEGYLKSKGYEILDLTCLDVKKVQQKAIELAQDGYFVVIVGKAQHPEVIAIRANAEKYSDKVLVADSSAAS